MREVQLITPAIYDDIGASYNSTRKADPTIVGKVLDHLQPHQDRKYLDLACGTGNYTLQYIMGGFHFSGVDQSKFMIERAKAQDSTTEWHIGDAENLPFENDTFQGMTCTNAIHHFRDLKKAMLECARVISSGALVIFCSTQEQMEKYWLNHYFPKMMRRSIEQMPKVGRILDSLEEAGFKNFKREPFFVTSDLEDLFLYSAKQRPELYLNETFRKNISSFAALADGVELGTGLAQLKADIESGTIKKIIHDSESDLGDYLIVSGVLEDESWREE